MEEKEKEKQRVARVKEDRRIMREAKAKERESKKKANKEKTSLRNQAKGKVLACIICKRLVICVIRCCM